jgi:DHA1 family tetracycline resistance protein-like MFS transporter
MPERGVMTKAPSNAGAFGFIIVTAILEMTTFGIVMPVLPKLLATLQGGTIAESATMLGVFGTVWAVMQFFASPVLGSLSDRFGRRPVLLVSMFGLGLDCVLMALAPNVAWLLVGRAVSGATAAGYSTAMAYVADVSQPDDRAAKFGLVGAAAGFGFILGPALGGLLGGIDLRLPFWVAAALCLVNAAYGYFVLPESLPKDKRMPFHWRRANFFGSLRLLRSAPVLLAIGLSMFFIRLGLDINPAIIVIYTQTRYAWSEQTVGLVLATYGVCSMLVQALLVGPGVKRLGERGALALGLCGAIIAFSIYALAPVGWMFLLGFPIGALMGLAHPAIQGIATRSVDATQQGQLQGALNGLSSVATIIAPVLFTQTFALGMSVSGASGLPYGLAALCFVAALALSWRATLAKQPTS